MDYVKVHRRRKIVFCRGALMQYMLPQKIWAYSEMNSGEIWEKLGGLQPPEPPCFLRLWEKLWLCSKEVVPSDVRGLYIVEDPVIVYDMVLSLSNQCGWYGGVGLILVACTFGINRRLYWCGPFCCSNSLSGLWPHRMYQLTSNTQGLPTS